jgi:hypothetical protein
MLVNNLESDHCNIYQHPSLKLKAYLNNRTSSETSKLFSDSDNSDDSADVNQVDYIPSIKELTQMFDYTFDVGLTQMEIWVESCLEQWIDRPSLLGDETNRFEI